MEFIVFRNKIVCTSNVQFPLLDTVRGVKPGTFRGQGHVSKYKTTIMMAYNCYIGISNESTIVYVLMYVCTYHHYVCM